MRFQFIFTENLNDTKNLISIENVWEEATMFIGEEVTHTQSQNSLYINFIKLKIMLVWLNVIKWLRISN